MPGYEEEPAYDSGAIMTIDDVAVCRILTAAVVASLSGVSGVSVLMLGELPASGGDASSAGGDEASVTRWVRHAELAIMPGRRQSTTDEPDIAELRAVYHVGFVPKAKDGDSAYEIMELAGRVRRGLDELTLAEETTGGPGGSGTGHRIQLTRAQVQYLDQDTDQGPMTYAVITVAGSVTRSSGTSFESNSPS